MTPRDSVGDLSAEQQRELLRKLLERRVRDESRFPMSVQQRGLWYAFLRDRGDTTFNVFLPSRIRSRLDVQAFRRAVGTLVQRHECLRTTFGSAGDELFQQTRPSLEPEFREIDATALGAEDIREAMAGEVARPFDLQRGPLLRVTVFRRSADDWYVVATTHHIAVDFWSLVVLLSELRRIYARLNTGVDLSLPPAENRYASYVRQQAAMLAGPKGESLRGYWKQKLDTVPAVIEWPADFKRPATFSGRAGVVPIEVESETTAEIRSFAARHQVTFSTVVLAAVQVLVWNYTSQSRFLIGTPFSGRSRREFEQTVGFFVNLLPLVADFEGDPCFKDVVRAAAGELLGALEHEPLPLAEIVTLRRPPRDVSRSPLVQISYTFEQSQLKEEEGRAGYLFPTAAEPRSAVGGRVCTGDSQSTSGTGLRDFGGLAQEPFFVPVPTCQYDLEFVFERSGDRLQGMIYYCRDLFAEDSMRWVAENFVRLIPQLLSDPEKPLSRLSWGAPDSTGVVEPACRQPDDEPLLLPEAVSRQAAAAPGQVALLCRDGAVGYGELVHRSARIAAALGRRGIAAGSLVPVVAGKGPAVTAALLGVIASGAAVVPIDGDRPSIDLEELVEDTRAPLVIVQDRADLRRALTSESLEPRGQPAEVVTIEELLRPVPGDVGGDEATPQSVASATACRRNDLCYVVYTSGTTGRAKGVMIEHGSIDNTLRWRREAVPLDRHDRVLTLLSHQFDAGFGIVLSVLTQGATLVWPDRGGLDVDAILRQITRDRITILAAPSSVLAILLDRADADALKRLRQLWTGGETMPRDLPERVRRTTGARLWNFYGPTEAAVEAAAADVTDHDARRPVPIGEPVRRTEILVLGPAGQPLPPTVPGELAICGPGLARGYLGQPERTAEAFPRLADGRRVYRTGDYGRVRPDGLLEFLGRRDRQRKIAGYRIELDEIESVLRSFSSVRDVAVDVRDESSATPWLAAYVVFEGEGRASLAELRRHASRRLAAYKQPRRIVAVDEIPRTANGKLDRTRLPAVDASERDSTSDSMPRTALERTLAEVWAETLSLDSVDLHHSFFDLGGASLQAATMTARLCDELGVEVPTALVFDLADIAGMAERLTELHPAEMQERFGKESVDFYRAAAPTGQRSSASPVHSLLVPFRTSGDRPPLFMVHPPGGIVVCYRELAECCGDEQPFYGIRSRGLHGDEPMPETIESMAAEYVEAVKAVQSTGPYLVGGWSLGGLAAFEVARQLSAAGDAIGPLLLLDTAIPDRSRGSGAAGVDAGREYGLDMTLDELAQLSADEQLPLLWQHARQIGVLGDATPEVVVQRTLEELRSLFHHHVRLSLDYRLTPADLSVVLVRPREVPFGVSTADDRGWSAFASDVRVELVGGHHHSMVQQPHVRDLAGVIRRGIRHED